MRAVRSTLLASLALASACGRSEGIPDDQLGTLVIAPKEKHAAINVARATKDPAELGRALATPYRDIVTALGPHTYTFKSTNWVDENGKRVSELTDTTKLELGTKDTFHGTYENSADYGREAIFEGGKMYLRPRYQRFHGRAPETPEEPGQVRDSYFDSIFATWELLAPAVEVSDGGAATVAGRSGRKIIVKQAPSPRSNPPETLDQRKWREKRTIEGVSGEIILDAEKGVPLSVKLAGTVNFSRDGRRFTMKVTLDSALASTGAVAIAAPPPDMVVATPERLREVDDRDFLLQGIAPPLRKNEAPAGSASGSK
jgi:hypothetical protein